MATKLIWWLIEETPCSALKIKSGQTFQKDFLSSVIWLNKLQNQRNGVCIYGGDKSFQIDEISVHSWKDLPELF